MIFSGGYEYEYIKEIELHHLVLFLSQHTLLFLPTVSYQIRSTQSCLHKYTHLHLQTSVSGTVLYTYTYTYTYTYIHIHKHTHNTHTPTSPQMHTQGRATPHQKFTLVNHTALMTNQRLSQCVERAHPQRHTIYYTVTPNCSPMEIS